MIAMLLSEKEIKEMQYLLQREMDEVKIQQDIVKAKTAFEKLNVKNIKLLRAPTGHFDQKTLKIAERYGYTVVHWSIDSKDWKNPGVDVVMENISNAKKGDIILLHASDSAQQTAKALPLIVENLKGKNLKLVTVSEMIANAQASTSEIN